MENKSLVDFEHGSGYNNVRFVNVYIIILHLLFEGCNNENLNLRIY